MAQAQRDREILKNPTYEQVHGLYIGNLGDRREFFDPSLGKEAQLDVDRVISKYDIQFDAFRGFQEFFNFMDKDYEHSEDLNSPKEFIFRAVLLNSGRRYSNYFLQLFPNTKALISFLNDQNISKQAYKNIIKEYICRNQDVFKRLFPTQAAWTEFVTQAKEGNIDIHDMVAEVEAVERKKRSFRIFFWMGVISTETLGIGIPMGFFIWALGGNISLPFLAAFLIAPIAYALIPEAVAAKLSLKVVGVGTFLLALPVAAGVILFGPAIAEFISGALVTYTLEQVIFAAAFGLVAGIIPCVAVYYEHHSKDLAPSPLVAHWFDENGKLKQEAGGDDKPRASRGMSPQAAPALQPQSPTSAGEGHKEEEKGSEQDSSKATAAMAREAERRTLELTSQGNDWQVLNSRDIRAATGAFMEIT
ncbi:MAG: hypothetical protein K0Q74_291 [Gammaproteobacteria bacterium]|jgi:hypothetical protein|nr:hypothetical protein [Gammaproteobacteria bacterium]